MNTGCSPGFDTVWFNKDCLKGKSRDISHSSWRLSKGRQVFMNLYDLTWRLHAVGIVLCDLGHLTFSIHFILTLSISFVCACVCVCLCACGYTVIILPITFVSSHYDPILQDPETDCPMMGTFTVWIDYCALAMLPFLLLTLNNLNHFSIYALMSSLTMLSLDTILHFTDIIIQSQMEEEKKTPQFPYVC